MTDKLREMLEALPRWEPDYIGWRDDRSQMVVEPEGGYLEREAVLAALAAAPQPAPEDGTAECEVAWVTDSLWSHKPAPQPAPETMAWAVVDEDGRIDADSIAKDAMDVRISPKPCLRVVPVMIRVVEGGDDE